MLKSFFLAKNKRLGNSLALLWLGFCIPISRDPGSIPGQGTKVPQAIWHCQKSKQNPQETSKKPQTNWATPKPKAYNVKVWFGHNEKSYVYGFAVVGQRDCVFKGSVLWLLHLVPYIFFSDNPDSCHPGRLLPPTPPRNLPDRQTQGELLQHSESLSHPTQHWSPCIFSSFLSIHGCYSYLPFIIEC